MVAITASPAALAEPIVGYLRSTAESRSAAGERTTPILPFLTISRLAGAGARSLGRRLIE